MKHPIRKLIAVVLACAAVGLCAVPALPASAAAASAPEAVSSIERDAETTFNLPLDGSDATLILGRKYVFPTLDSFLFAGINYQLTTTNNSVIVIKDNEIKAVGVGTCTLTIKLTDDIVFKKTITVQMPEVTIKFDKSKLTIGNGEVTKLCAVLSQYGQSIQWSSSNKSIVSVDGSGKVTAKRQGTATITATLKNGKKASCQITVKPSPTSVTFNKKSVELGKGEASKLGIKLSAGSASYKTTFISDNPNVVTVNTETGEVVAKTTGTAKLTVITYNNKKATCTITVKKAPTTVKFDKTSLTINDGDTTRLKAIFPDGSTSGSLTYYSSNDRIVKINSSGLVSAIQKGTAYVSVRTYNGKVAICKVTVK